MFRPIPEYARKHVDVLKSMLKVILPEYYYNGKYTVSIYLWTDNDFQIELKCGITNDVNCDDSHEFTWNKHIGYIHKVVKY